MHRRRLARRGDPRLRRSGRAGGELRLLPRVAHRGGGHDPGQCGRAGGVGNGRGRGPARAPRARGASRAGRRLERLAPAHPAGARPRGARGRPSLQPRRAVSRPVGGCAFATPHRAPSAATSASAARCRTAGRSSMSATASPIAAPAGPPTGSSPAAGWPAISRPTASPTSGSRPSPTLLLPFPEPYDFELSTERFRVFGPDLANLWQDGALHRAVGGREVRIAAAPGGVDVEPLDEETRAVRREAARARVRARALQRVGTRSAGARRSSCPGSRDSGRRSRPTRSRASSPRSPPSRSRSTPRSRFAAASSSASALRVGLRSCVPDPRAGCGGGASRSSSRSASRAARRST